MKKIFLVISIAILVFLVFISLVLSDLYKKVEVKQNAETNNTTLPVSDNEVLQEEQEKIEKLPVSSAKPANIAMGKLVDVSGGTATGSVVASMTDEGYKLVAEFEDLPELKTGFFYEGWIVRQGLDLSVISTGATTQVEEKHSNTFESDLDLTDHTFYVLTLEPDDDDPAPAEHVLEGNLEQSN